MQFGKEINQICISMYVCSYANKILNKICSSYNVVLSFHKILINQSNSYGFNLSCLYNFLDLLNLVAVFVQLGPDTVW